MMEGNKKIDNIEEKNEIKSRKVEDDTILCKIQEEKYTTYLLLTITSLSFLMFLSNRFDFIWDWLVILLNIIFICAGLILLYMSYKNFTREKIRAQVIYKWKAERGWFLKAGNFKRVALVYSTLFLIAFLIYFFIGGLPFAAGMVTALAVILPLSYFSRPEIFVCEKGIVTQTLWSTNYLTPWSFFSRYKIFETEGAIKLKTKL